LGRLTNDDDVLARVGELPAPLKGVDVDRDVRLRFATSLFSTTMVAAKRPNTMMTGTMVYVISSGMWY